MTTAPKLKPTKPKREPDPLSRKEMITLRVTASEHGVLAKLADKYTAGNLGEWLRYSGLHFLPGGKDLI